MQVLAITLAVLISTQVTPRDLGRRQEQRRAKEEIRSGYTHTSLDPRFGGEFAFPSVAARARQYDIQMDDAFSAKIHWPHRYMGKVYDQLDKEGKEKLLDMQCQHIQDWGNPRLPGSEKYAISSDQVRRMMGLTPRKKPKKRPYLPPIRIPGPDEKPKATEDPK